jgi:tetratricopeptide (TPR) repeat protein
VPNRPSDESSEILRGKRLAFVGRLASMPRREAAQLVRRHGAVVVDRPDPSVHLLVVGEELPLGEESGADDPFDAATRQAIEQGGVEVLRETQLWQRLGMVEAEQEVHRLYTPAMLAGLLRLPVAVIRRWHRRGLIVPVREVRRLPYFDFREVATARRLAELLAAGMSPAAIEKKLAALARYVPEVERPLAQLSVIVEGREILLRQGDGLVEPGGQLRFDFTAAEQAAAPSAAAGSASVSIAAALAMGARAAESTPVAPAAELSRLAAELEESGQLAQAAELYRAAMAAEGPMPDLCFKVAELLYRLGDLGGARERYFMAIELDEDYLEARANLGCVLAELGERELAVAAFQGALAFHPDYADAHYHLARTLDDLGRTRESETHWEAFLNLAPDSPWALQARNRLGTK